MKLPGPKKAIRCQGHDRKTGRPCTHINLEVPVWVPKHPYIFRCKKCGSWNVVEV